MYSGLYIFKSEEEKIKTIKMAFPIHNVTLYLSNIEEDIVIYTY